MNRAFISLYVIIVLSIVLLGLALNKFWDFVDPAVENNPAIEDIFTLSEAVLLHSNSADKNKKIKILSQQLHHQIKLMSIDDFAKTQIAENIKSGKIVNASNEISNQFYKRIDNSDDVLVVSYKSENYQASPVYLFFMLIFYSAIAVIIFLWVWPLSRDLARLAQHTKHIGKDGVPESINISSRSVVFPFAVAFNNMAKRLSELIASQKEMTYAVSHELRTPLARMKFGLVMMEDNPLSTPLKKQLGGVQQDVLEMEALINALLAYAGFERQSQQLHQSPGHMQDLVQSIIARLSTKDASPIDIIVNDDSKGEIFLCEWSLMQTALQNLLDNAQGFARKVVIITLTTTNSDFVLTIEDDGPGVALEQRERIFESFVRLYSEETTRSGFGLGLALVKRILGWHNGFVTCTEARSGGAKFTLSWPKTRINEIYK